MTNNQIDVPYLLREMLPMTKVFPCQPFDTIALYSPTHLSTDGYPKSRSAATSWRYHSNEKFRANRSADIRKTDVFMTL
jgi:hypothetical protein